VVRIRFSSARFEKLLSLGDVVRMRTDTRVIEWDAKEVFVGESKFTECLLVAVALFSFEDEVESVMVMMYYKIKA